MSCRHKISIIFNQKTILMRISLQVIKINILHMTCTLLSSQCRKWIFKSHSCEFVTLTALMYVGCTSPANSIIENHFRLQQIIHLNFSGSAKGSRDSGIYAFFNWGVSIQHFLSKCSTWIISISNLYRFWYFVYRHMPTTLSNFRKLVMFWQS